MIPNNKRIEWIDSSRRSSRYSQLKFTINETTKHKQKNMKMRSKWIERWWRYHWFREYGMTQYINVIKFAFGSHRCFPSFQFGLAVLHRSEIQKKNFTETITIYKGQINETRYYFILWNKKTVFGTFSETMCQAEPNL